MAFEVIIADDNREVVDSLKVDCEKIDDIKVIACAYNRRQLIDFVLRAKPDLVITDIKMPKVSGVQAAKYIRKRDQRVQIVFLTAFDEYIFDAVEIYALDYLLKPVDKKRLYNTLEHAKMNQQRDTEGQILNFPTDEGETYIGANEIVFVEAQRKKIKIVTYEDKIYANMTFKTILEKKQNNMMQTHRSFLVNLDYVKEIKKINRSSFEIVFSVTDNTALLSNSYFEEFRSRIIEIKKLPKWAKYGEDF